MKIALYASCYSKNACFNMFIAISQLSTHIYEAVINNFRSFKVHESITT